MLKRCTRCKQEKDVSQFYTRHRRGGTELIPKCKKCEREMVDNYQRKNPWVKNKTNRNRRIFLQGYKAERGCKSCGERDYICLDFHHINKEEKSKKLLYKNNGGKERRGNWLHLSEEDLMEELKKVIVICSNCHRKLHRDESLKKGL